MAVTLRNLIAPWPALACHGDPELVIAAVVEDSRLVRPRDLFVAVAGSGHDGHDHVEHALASGAGAVAVDAHRLDQIRAALPDDVSVTWVSASSTRGLSARLARECEERPDDHLCAVGVTGTNGKTTSAFLLQGMLGALRGPCGLLGTIRYDDGASSEAASLTTPGGPVLYRWLARMRDAGCGSVAMELSSHALDQERPGELALDVALLTNLGRDHLDYHGTLDAYLAAKARITDLLDGPRRCKPDGVVVINAGDPALANLDLGGRRVFSYTVDPDVGDVDLRLRNARLDLGGTRLELDWRGQPIALTSPLVGRFNVANLSAALAVGLALDESPEACVAALASVRQVPGRMEQFRLPAGGLAVVDYAHTHDALAAVLTTCRELTRGDLVVVFGCGGDRDRGKRPLMADVAARSADRVWITSDNPRTEDPVAICHEVEAGYLAVSNRQARAYTVEVDRRAAIEAALATAGPTDVVVVAGKGHEDYQLVGDRVLHLDDREVVREWIVRQGHEA